MVIEGDDRPGRVMPRAGGPLLRSLTELLGCREKCRGDLEQLIFTSISDEISRSRALGHTSFSLPWRQAFDGMGSRSTGIARGRGACGPRVCVKRTCSIIAHISTSPRTGDGRPRSKVLAPSAGTWRCAPGSVPAYRSLTGMPCGELSRTRMNGRTPCCAGPSLDYRRGGRPELIRAFDGQMRSPPMAGGAARRQEQQGGEAHGPCQGAGRFGAILH